MSFFTDINGDNIIETSPNKRYIVVDRSDNYHSFNDEKHQIQRSMNYQDAHEPFWCFQNSKNSLESQIDPEMIDDFNHENPTIHDKHQFVSSSHYFKNLSNYRDLTCFKDVNHRHYVPDEENLKFIREDTSHHQNHGCFQDHYHCGVPCISTHHDTRNYEIHPNISFTNYNDFSKCNSENHMRKMKSMKNISPNYNVQMHKMEQDDHSELESYPLQASYKDINHRDLNKDREGQYTSNHNSFLSYNHHNIPLNINEYGYRTKYSPKNIRPSLCTIDDQKMISINSSQRHDYDINDTNGTILNDTENYLTTLTASDRRNNNNDNNNNKSSNNNNNNDNVKDDDYGLRKVSNVKTSNIHNSICHRTIPNNKTKKDLHKELMMVMGQARTFTCLVCGDNANGIHYGILSCEGCKGFFRRISMNKKKLRCIYDGMCKITPELRVKCSYCRYKKCISVGMSLKAIKLGRRTNADKLSLFISPNIQKIKESSSLNRKSIYDSKKLQKELNFDCVSNNLLKPNVSEETNKEDSTGFLSTNHENDESPMDVSMTQNMKTCPNKKMIHKYQRMTDNIHNNDSQGGFDQKISTTSLLDNDFDDSSTITDANVSIQNGVDFEPNSKNKVKIASIKSNHISIHEIMDILKDLEDTFNRYFIECQFGADSTQDPTMFTNYSTRKQSFENDLMTEMINNDTDSYHNHNSNDYFCKKSDIDNTEKIRIKTPTEDVDPIKCHIDDVKTKSLDENVQYNTKSIWTTFFTVCEQILKRIAVFFQDNYCQCSKGQINDLDGDLIKLNWIIYREPLIIVAIYMINPSNGTMRANNHEFKILEIIEKHIEEKREECIFLELLLRLSKDMREFVPYTTPFYAILMILSQDDHEKNYDHKEKFDEIKQLFDSDDKKISSLDPNYIDKLKYIFNKCLAEKFDFNVIRSMGEIFIQLYKLNSLQCKSKSLPNQDENTDVLALAEFRNKIRVSSQEILQIIDSRNQFKEYEKVISKSRCGPSI